METKKLIEEMADALIDAGGWAWSAGSRKAKDSAERARTLALKAREHLKEMPDGG